MKSGYDSTVKRKPEFDFFYNLIWVKNLNYPIKNRWSLMCDRMNVDSNIKKRSNTILRGCWNWCKVQEYPSKYKWQCIKEN
jgi:hypothetical protein